jgi:hypothetical protein
MPSAVATKMRIYTYSDKVSELLPNVAGSALTGHTSLGMAPSAQMAVTQPLTRHSCFLMKRAGDI